MQHRSDICVGPAEKNKSMDFRSITKDNAKNTTSHDLSSKHKNPAKSLTYDLKYEGSHTFALYNDDGVLKDDTMGSNTIYTPDLYNKRNPADSRKERRNYEKSRNGVAD